VKIVVIADKTNVTNNGSIDTVRIEKSATSAITNSGTIVTVDNQGTSTIDNAGFIRTVKNSGAIVSISNIGSVGGVNNIGSVGNIKNIGIVGSINNSGTIGTISNSGTVGAVTNSGAVRMASNSGTVGSINSSNGGSVGIIKNSDTIGDIVLSQNASISNEGLIKGIAIGAGTTVIVYNSGLVNGILIGEGGILDGNNTGFAEKPAYGAHARSTAQWVGSSARTSLFMKNQVILDSLVTKADQGAGVGVSRIGGKIYWDITTAVENALLRDVGEFLDHKDEPRVLKDIWYSGQVGNKGKWNLKYREPDGKHWEETLGISFPGYSTQMVLAERLVVIEDVGNITFGYLGAAVGFGQSYLNFGSSVNNFLGHGFQSDNEHADQAKIEIGINWYKNGGWR
jgi:hypothetical protein